MSLRIFQNAQMVHVVLFSDESGTDFVLDSDYRMIPLGDIDLQELRFSVSYSSVYRRRGKGIGVTRRYYAAQVLGRTSSMTVVMYHGDAAEEVRSSAPVTLRFDSVIGLAP